MIKIIRAIGATAFLLSSTNVLAQAPASRLPTAVADQMLVSFAPGTTGAAIASAHRQAGASELRTIDRINVRVVRIASGNTVAALAAYRSNPNVLYAEPNLLRPMLLPNEGQDPQPPFGLGIDYLAEQYGLHNTGQSFYYDEFTGEPGAITGVADADIDAPEAWDLDTGSSLVTVAVLDTGVDCQHADLAGKCIDSQNFGPSTTPDDVIAHGTHVAGIIGAQGNNGIGVAGVSWNARLASLKVCYEYNDPLFGLIGLCDSAAVAEALIYAADRGYQVANMSFGAPDISATEAAAVTYAWDHGVVLVAAAANAYSTTPMYPAALPEVIAVAATDWYDNLAGFSNFGANWVSIAAPGYYTFSTMPNAACGLPSSDPEGCYGWLSGTSMASPTVAGAAALVWSRLGGSASNAAVRATLEANADPVGALGQNELAWTAHGRLNAYRAVANAAGGGPPPPPAADGIHVGDLDGTRTISGPNWQARVVVRVHNQAETPVPGATVTGRWSGGFSGTVACATDAAGQCVFDTSPMPKRNAQVTFEVTGLSGAQSYQATANHDPDGDSDGRTITVLK